MEKTEVWVRVRIYIAVLLSALLLSMLIISSRRSVNGEWFTSWQFWAVVAMLSLWGEILDRYTRSQGVEDILLYIYNLIMGKKEKAVEKIG